MDEQLTLQQVKQKMVLIQALTLPGSFLIAFALYGMVVAKDKLFHPLLGEEQVVYAMLAVGVLLYVVLVPKLLPLFRLHQKLSQDNEAL